MNTLKVGDRVEWKYQGAEGRPPRICTVLVVVPPGVQPVEPEGYKRAIPFWGPPRKEVSYIIAMGEPKVYWPLTKNLTPLPPEKFSPEFEKFLEAHRPSNRVDGGA